MTDQALRTPLSSTATGVMCCTVTADAAFNMVREDVFGYCGRPTAAAAAQEGRQRAGAFGQTTAVVKFTHLLGTKVVHWRGLRQHV